ncbi:BRO-N domain-containing protein [Moraxella sp. ZY200743]|uniref:BRO-N domain-containing protein n=1 Tax=Moraxella sp. ZY200743 TaxID=2911970 RepID=UPI003D7D2173
MSNLITQLNFQSSQNVRIAIDENKQPWFMAKDVCNILGYENPRRTIDLHCKENGIQKIPTPTKGGLQNLSYINQPNLLRLIVKSRKPEAQKFEEWVFEEVLPTILKTGTYTTPTVQSNQLSDKDWTNLKHLVWLCENNFHFKKSASHAIWARLRAVTGVKSPAKFSREHLPIIATELERIFRMSEQYARTIQATERLIIRNVLKYGDDEPMDFFLAEMVEKATDYNQAKAERLPAFFGKELLELVA